MEISVDRARCAGHAICTIITPEVFDLDDEGKAILLSTANQSTAGEIRESAAACPAAAIKLAG